MADRRPRPLLSVVAPTVDPAVTTAATKAPTTPTRAALRIAASVPRAGRGTARLNGTVGPHVDHLWSFAANSGAMSPERAWRGRRASVDSPPAGCHLTT